MIRSLLHWIARITFGFVLTFPFSAALAQPAIPIGQWRTHVSYNSVRTVAASDSKIYAASGAGLMILDRQDREVSAYTSMNGLAGGIIQSISFDPASGQLLIGYEDGSLDLAGNDEISHFDWLENVSISGSRAVNHITCFNGFAYLSTGYGVVVFDIGRREVRETWRDLGAGGTSLAVYQSAVLDDNIFLATEKGVLTGDLADNLLDFNNWRRDDADVFGNPVRAVASFNGIVYAAIDGIGLFHRENDAWTMEDILQNATFASLNSSADHLVICEPGHVWLLSDDNTLQEATSPSVTSCLFALEDEQGDVWIGDAANGLLSNSESFVANGPAVNAPRKLRSFDGKVFAIEGGYTDDFQATGNPGKISSFSNGMWSTQTASINDVTDIQTTGGVVFVSSYGHGIQAGDIGAPDALYNDDNSSLINTSPPGDHVNVTDMAADANGLWAANYGASQSLHRFEGGTWQGYSFPEAASRYPVSLAVDYAGNVWAVLNPSSGGGLLVFRRHDNSAAYLTDAAGGGGLPHRNARCIAPDRDGAMWVGTDNGVAYFVNADAVFGTDVNAVRPIFENRFLLNGEMVTAIAVDGGNRKWVGTENGVWLFGPEGDELVYHFTAENSPLPSGRVRSIAIEDQSGEVFLATEGGLVSFRSDATKSEGDFSLVRIFPNPVTAEFNGLVGITGLAQDAVVKITDVAGNLVWQTYAAGGTATWNVRHHNGQRAATGIYLVFSASVDGSQEYVGKIAVVE